MVVSDPQDIVHHGQLPLPGVSHHDLIYCVYSIKTPKNTTKFLTYRDFKNMDEIAFMTNVLATPWTDIEHLSSVDDMVDALNDRILNIYNKHVPLVTKRITKHRPAPWLTKE